MLTTALLGASCADQQIESADGYEVANRVVAKAGHATGEDIVGYTSSTTGSATTADIRVYNDLAIAQAEAAAKSNAGRPESIEEKETAPVLAESECERTVTTDEYGFEQQTFECGEVNGITDELKTTTAADDPQKATADDQSLQEALPPTTAGSKTDESVDDQPPPSSTSDTNDSSSTETTSIDKTTTTSSEAVSAKQIVDYEGTLPVRYFSTLVATAPTDSLRSWFTAIGDRLDKIERYCGTDSVRWLAEISRLSDDAIAVADLVKAEQSYVGSIEATALARSFTERSLMESGCANPGTSDGALEASAATPVTSKASIAFAGLDQALRNSEYGPLFHQYSTLPNYLWLRNETSTIDAVLIGTSQVGAALEVKTMNSQMDTEFGSAQLPGGLAEIQTWWIPQVAQEVEPNIVVWFVGPLDLFVGCPSGGRANEYLKFGAARAKAFSRNGWLANIDPLDRILGQATPEQTVQGDHPKRPGFDAESDAYQRDRYPKQFSTRKFCKKRAETIGNEARRLITEGRRVVIVGMPVHPDLAKARPGGAAGFAEDIDKFVSESLSDVEFIDLTTSMQRSEPWSDLTHVHSGGASEFTQLLIQELRVLGIS